jgi:hypothetical protein
VYEIHLLGAKWLFTWKNWFQTKNQPTQNVYVYIFIERQLSGKGLISFDSYQGHLVRENNTPRETKCAGGD